LQVDTYVKKEDAKPPQADKDEWEIWWKLVNLKLRK
jgi:hypothetical protein